MSGASQCHRMPALAAADGLHLLWAFWVIGLPSGTCLAYRGEVDSEAMKAEGFRIGL